MAHCPNCKKRLNLWNVSQICPHCGVNMRFFDYDKRFYHDAKESELSMARVHVFVRTLKAAFIGAKISIARLVLMLLPVGALMLPLAKGGVDFPFFHADIDLSALGLFGAFSGGALDYLLPMMTSPVNGAAVAAFVIAALALAVALVCAVAQLLTTVLGFINIKRTAVANCVFALLAIAGVIVSEIFASKAGKAAGFEGSMISCSLSFGWAIQIAAFAAFFAINFPIAKNGIPIQLDEGMAERVEIAKKVRRGEVKLDELPQPIVETEATRKIREEIEKAKAEYQEKLHKKEDPAQ